MKENQELTLTSDWQKSMRLYANRMAQEVERQITAGAGLKRGMSIDSKILVSLMEARGKLHTIAQGFAALRDHIQTYENYRADAEAELTHWVGLLRQTQREIRELTPKE